MHRCDYSLLTLPNDQKYLEVVRVYVTASAKRMGFDDKNSNGIAEAAWEAASNAIKHAFEQFEQNQFQITTERVALGIKVSIRDKGLPFDFIGSPDSHNSGRGIAVIRRLVDEVEFHNLGHEGKEVVLIKYFGDKTVQDYGEVCRQTSYNPKTNKFPRTPEYRIRLVQSNEAIEISRNMFRAYGYSYSLPHAYYPDRTARLITSGSLIAAGAVTPAGEFIGHCILIKHNDNAVIVEIGLAAVRPEYRGHGVFLKLTQFLVNKAKILGLLGVYGQPVTNHLFSQKTSLKLGFSDCAVLLGYIPESEVFRAINESLPQRETLLLHFLYTNKPERIILYPPSRHAAIIKEVYGALDLAIDSDTFCNGVSLYPESELRVDATGPPGSAAIVISRCGADVAKIVETHLNRLLFDRIEVIYLYLNMTDVCGCSHIDDLEKIGFFFAGILPGYFPGDALILQYLNHVPIDYDKIRVQSKLGRDLLKYVKGHDPNI